MVNDLAIRPDNATDGLKPDAPGQVRNLARLAVLLAPIPFLLVMFTMRLTNPQAYLWTVREGSILEKSQFFIYLAAGGVAMMVGILINRNGRQLLGWFHYALAMGLIFIAGEEISWGQRPLNIEVPEVIAALNTQGELTVHNLRGIQDVLHMIYAVIGIGGGCAWMVMRWALRERPNASRHFAAPPPVLTLYFLLLGIYYLYGEAAWWVAWWPSIYDEVAGIPLWKDQEAFETLLAVGFLGFTTTNLQRIRRLQREASCGVLKAESPVCVCV